MPSVSGDHCHCGGLFYYLNYVWDEADITEGTLVRRKQSMEMVRREQSAEVYYE